jgi:hypothetical protein
MLGKVGCDRTALTRDSTDAEYQSCALNQYHPVKNGTYRKEPPWPVSRHYTNVPRPH